MSSSGVNPDHSKKSWQLQCSSTGSQKATRPVLANGTWWGAPGASEWGFLTPCTCFFWGQVQMMISPYPNHPLLQPLGKPAWDYRDLLPLLMGYPWFLLPRPRSVDFSLSFFNHQSFPHHKLLTLLLWTQANLCHPNTSPWPCLLLMLLFHPSQCYPSSCWRWVGPACFPNSHLLLSFVHSELWVYAWLKLPS